MMMLHTAYLTWGFPYLRNGTMGVLHLAMPHKQQWDAETQKTKNVPILPLARKDAAAQRTKHIPCTKHSAVLGGTNPTTAAATASSATVIVTGGPSAA
jgi:hypothetical protein